MSDRTNIMGFFTNVIQEVGGAGNYIDVNTLRGNKASTSIEVDDSDFNIGTAPSHYFEPFEYEEVTELQAFNEDIRPLNILEKRYRSSSKLKISNGLNAGQGFLGLEAEEVIINAVLNVNAGGAVFAPSGRTLPNGSSHTSGVAGIAVFEEFLTMPRGGRGGSSRSYPSQIVGSGGSSTFGASGSGGQSSNASGSGQCRGGSGGGTVFILANSISGNGTIRAVGANGYVNSSVYTFASAGGGGGGVVLVIARAWSGTVGFAVGGGSKAGYGSAGGGQTGSYAIYKIEGDNSLTLMVHSANGSSAQMNGETPVHGADASIAW